VQAAIERLRGSMTVVLIAHRLSTVRRADRIVVLDRGKLIQTGFWDALIKNPTGAFAALLGAQPESSVDAL
jgi:ABC-type multidrug transport system fused ATPase/permease subunit